MQTKLLCRSVTALLLLPCVAQAHVVEDPNDVMNGAMPKFPAFAKLAKKPGYLRGQVRDTAGKPLKGARIMVGSTAIGGAMTYATAKSDEKGLYEIELPLGSCRVRSAGYTVTLNRMRCALPLHPADDDFDSFSSKKGDVENLVLLPYGIASEAGVSQNPGFDFYYYGGSVRLVYSGGEAAAFLPVGKTIEVVLSPATPLIDGRTGRSFTIRETVRQGDAQTLNINNLPAAVYKVQARLVEDDVPLTLAEWGTSPRPGGLKPKAATGEALLAFRPKNADPAAVVTNVSGWDQILIELKPSSPKE